MLIKRNSFMSFGPRAVKKMTASALAGLAICTTAIAPAAFASSSPFVDTVVTVKIKLSDLEADDGAEKVYAQLKKRAKSFCRSDSETLNFFGQSVSECVDDLVGQFIESADVDALKVYHFSQQNS